MSETKLSCGLLVLNEFGELLVGHSAGNTIWDLPKGMIDEGEDAMGCALREAREEFGLKFAPDRLTDLGQHAYYKGKDLHLFWVRTTTKETQLDDMRCTSFFQHYVTKQTMPEIDGYVRIPRHGGHDSMLMADSVPASSRTPFHGDGGQHTILKADTPAVS